MYLLQQGWGMLNMIEEYLRQHDNSGIIFSPRICDRDQLERYLPAFSVIPNCSLFFDPHFFEPRTDLERILSYPYFNDYDFSTRNFNSRSFCERVMNYQTDVLHLHNIILPGRFTNALNEAWLEMHHEFAIVGSRLRPQYSVYSTVALGPDVILNPDNWNAIIDEIINYQVDGIYFVYEHPTGDYFLDEEFLYVLLDGLLSVSLSGKKIIVGYTNQQTLSLYAAGVDAIASGNYRNVRLFDHLNSTDRDMENMRRATWYFDGNSFGEYRIPALALGYRRGLRTNFGPITEHSRALLENDRPSNVRWPEQNAFAHYLHLMHDSCMRIERYQKRDRANQVLAFYREKQAAITALAQGHFAFGERGFENTILSTLGTLETFINDRRENIQQL